MVVLFAQSQVQGNTWYDAVAPNCQFWGEQNVKGPGAAFNPAQFLDFDYLLSKTVKLALQLF